VKATHRLSLNQITIDQWSLEEAVEACASAGIEWIGVWRHRLEEMPLAKAAKLVASAGLRVSSVCRGGFFPAADAGTARRREADNMRAIEQAAALRAPTLVLVCGPPCGRDLREARRMIHDGIERLVPHARSSGVRLAVEPLHPMLISERSAIVSLEEACTLAEHFDPVDVGVVVDTYHVFWDFDVEAQISRAGERIAGFHVSDWVTPAGDVASSRVMMGEGIIDFRALATAVANAGYTGPVEVEVINERFRELPGFEVLERVVASYGNILLDPLSTTEVPGRS
jgi:sugar phosphate isomerase/epimerase